MIEIQDLTKYYNDFCAVDHVTLSVRPGEILGLLGPNGAGKTTALRMLTGYFRPTSGRISVKDLHMPQDTLKIKSLIGYLPESAPLYHNMLVYDYLTYVAELKGLANKNQQQERFKALSDLCGLSGIMHKPIATLSKGLKQRVGLAHAMMTDPEILILDEPTSGLDPNQIAEIRDIIRNIGKEKTIVFSTHILSEAEATCDRIVIINKGKVVADDTTASLKKGALHDSFIRLTLKGPDPQKAQDFLTAMDQQLEITALAPEKDGLVSFEIRSPANRDVRPDIYLKIKQTDWIIMELAKEAQALEKIFQKLTREDA
ncbi:MAG: ABC transporter ATP-binding protein [Desulfotignum sp.]|nr:ABC transporter ATP-binding protein [Desulfotignum sp.]MCF8114419.1 ABC transporter ATP-binding protein [Desulfotignum sp.]MCF8124685.1 ABC transporter ATP-binding protein [Desulfotignum sp.]